MQLVFFRDSILDLLIRDVQGFLGRIKSLFVGILCLEKFPCQLIKLLLEQAVSVLGILLVSKMGLCIVPESNFIFLESYFFFFGSRSIDSFAIVWS